MTRVFHYAGLCFSVLFCLIIVPSVHAQQTSKAKTKEKLYEKTGENKNVQVRNAVNINSEGDEFSPIWFEDGIVFTASKGKHGPKGRNGQVGTELYFSSLDPNKEPYRFSRFSLELSSHRNEATPTFSRDYNRMFFTQNNIIDGVERTGRDKVLHLKIFEVKKGKVDWVNKRELPFNSDHYSCMHPSLSADEKTLYFSSDMPGGFGGFDLYKTEFVKGTWTTPVNLGPGVNTPKNDVFPFIFPSGDLYFSSAGHNTLGGYDIFRVHLGNGKPTELINLGEPFNSTFDDFGYILSDDGKRGFFSSNRPGGLGRDDIYLFTVETAMPGMEKIEPKTKTILVTDMQGNPIQGAELRILAYSNGMYTGKNKDLYRSRIEQVDKNSNEVRIRLIKQEAEELGEPDEYTNANGEVRIDFQPYTDYLIIANTDKWTAETTYKVEADDAGETIRIVLEKPAAKLLSGRLLNESGHKLGQARLRFTNLDTNEQDHISTDDQGNFAVALPKGSYQLRIMKDGFKTEYITLDFDPANSAFREYRLEHISQPANKLPVTDEIKPGYIITIDKIEYNKGMYLLNRQAQVTLDRVADLLREYPQMEIDIISHTDAVGSEADNMALSKARAQLAQEYIIIKGKGAIKQERIRAIGKGETEVKNHCKDGVKCEDQEHAVNRRTEIFVRKV